MSSGCVLDDVRSPFKFFWLTTHRKGLTDRITTLKIIKFRLLPECLFRVLSSIDIKLDCHKTGELASDVLCTGFAARCFDCTRSFLTQLLTL